MVFDQVLFQYGISGIFIAYLIYDKQVLMKGFMSEFKETIQDLKDHLRK